MKFPIPEGGVNPDLLFSEIVGSGSVLDPDILVSGGEVEVFGEIVDLTALEAIISNHEANPLSARKAAKIAAIDSRTDDLIRQGFAFDGKNFSLSTEAQGNWTALFVFKDILSWPIPVTTNDDEEYSLTLENLPSFCLSAAGVVNAAISSGRALKIAANAATTIAELDAVVDNR
jgi:hypothetical protein